MSTVDDGPVSDEMMSGEMLPPDGMTPFCDVDGGSAISPERRWYMERHFGLGSVAQADGMARFEPSYCCINNDDYAPVSPPSPLQPLGGDSPFSCSCLHSWFHKGQPDGPDPFDDPQCPDCAPTPNVARHPWFPGTGWYPNGSSTYRGNLFEGRSTCLSWIWKHNSAQYMWENFHLFAGPQGFKSSTDLFQDGNFGTHEGLNWGMPVWDDIGLGYQKGFQATQNNWNGGTGTGVANHYRSQIFVTAGLFHRPIRGTGVQGGLAIDFLNDNYYAKTNLTQLRFELSYLGSRHNEIGFFATQHLDSSTGISPYTLQPTTFQATNQYNAFVRRNFASGANARLWGGVTGSGDGIVGGDATLYLSERWALQSAFNYLIPKHDATIPPTLREDLALTINLMWWPGYRTPASRYNPYRQLFNVADNTTFLVTPK
ncbi:MAG TPA: DUF6666 family protein [Pirellulales bacterium]|nr:DUF6666 family protein [Pirellulales bacterium]